MRRTLLDMRERGFISEDHRQECFNALMQINGMEQSGDQLGAYRALVALEDAYCQAMSAHEWDDEFISALADALDDVA